MKDRLEVQLKYNNIVVAVLPVRLDSYSSYTYPTTIHSGDCVFTTVSIGVSATGYYESLKSYDGDLC